MNARSARLHDIKAKIAGAKELYLVVSDNGDMAFDWADWTDVSGMKFSLRKSQPGGDVQIALDSIAVFPELPETVFTSPEPFDASTLTAAAP